MRFTFAPMFKNINFKSVLIGGFFTAFVPVGAFLYLKLTGHDGRIILPKTFGIDKIDTNIVDGKTQYDTTFHTVKDITLINQLGDTVSINNTLKGKILILDFFFTSCTSICPELSKNMKLLNRAFVKNDSLIQFLSISVDPKNDSVLKLRLYADKYNANHDKWFFLTGKKEDIYNYARKELFLDLEQGDGGEDDFIHPEKFVLIDKYRNIRGYYNGLDSNNVRLAAEDASYLMVEKNRIHEKNNR